MKHKKPPHYVRYFHGGPSPGDSDRWSGNDATRSFRSGMPYAGGMPHERNEIAEEVDPADLPPLPHRSIMVPLDGSPFSEHALPLALEIARRNRARLSVVHASSWLSVAHSVDLYTRGDCYARFRRQQKEYLHGVVRRLKDVSSVPVMPILLEEEGVAQSLCSMAESGADLVVMATHGRGAFARFWYGSVTDTLLRHLSIPIVVLRGDKRVPELASRPTVRRVLVPLDGSRLSQRVLEPLVAWGALGETEYTLVRVVDPRGVPDSDSVGQQSSKFSTMATNLQRAARQLTRRGFRVNTTVLFGEDPAQAIHNYVRDCGVDLIALATSGRAGLSRLFRGSVADRVIRRASVPVMVLRSVP